MNNEKSILEELDLFVQKHHIERHSSLEKYYLNLRSDLEKLLIPNTTKNAIQSALYCFHLESKLQLFIFYLQHLEQGSLDMSEGDIVNRMEIDYANYSTEIICTELIGEVSILMKQTNQDKTYSKAKMRFRGVGD
ncbi:MULTISPECIES: DUF7006 family protein [unclassified Enterococcus]|uniref:DUF7006 family protein n=1 Tax=unclassified Enterococcus TaxID=2608891 RepID=UPI001CE196B2|nr:MULTISPECIES: hypothetical protein [unclassified Enterococcus]MCA5012554.1 hypothetical protein [Enterococcus sp. S23]MCA5015805.1 hypothetical protein [Enterococcus sp. S22(2020)]